MAILKESILGKVKGKMGGLVFYEVNGEMRMRSTPAGYRDRKSPKQLAHRARVKGIAGLFAGLDMQLVVYWNELAAGTTMNGYNLFMSTNLKWLDEEGRVADSGRLTLCRGDLEMPRWVKVKGADGEEWMVREEGKPVAGLEREEMLARLAKGREEDEMRWKMAKEKKTVLGRDGKSVRIIDGEVLEERTEEAVEVKRMQVGPERTVEISWDTKVEEWERKMDYFRVIICLKDREKELVFSTEETLGVCRDEGRMTWRFPERVDNEELKGLVRLYGYFKGHFTNEVSDSFYLGAFEV